ncbi:MAG: acyl-CoA thioesterase [Burkholderiales bacterium]|nr:MAG: acyl-CoA thioesterase [Burkholderiales bacterium]
MKVYRIEFTVEWGDCDPAGIVFHPNFYSWIDAAVRHMFEEAGLDKPTMVHKHGWKGVPVVENGARFLRPATFGERIVVESSVVDWQPKRFRLEHRIVRGEDLLVEAWSVRAIGVPHPENPRRMVSLEIPDWVKALFD